MTRIPDRLVERVHLGEASEADRARVLADPDARARLEALPARDAAFFEAQPADRVVPEIERRAHLARTRDAVGGEGGRSWTPAMMLLGPVLAILLALVLGPQVIPTADPTGPTLEPTRAKGLQARLRVYQRTSEGPKRLAPGQVLLRGDVLQVAYVAGDARHGVIVSIDGRGTVTRHFPIGAGASALTPGEHVLPEAYELDDAPDFERFFLVSGELPIEAAVVAAAAEALAASGKAKTGPLSLPEGLQQTSMLVRKEVP